MSAHIRSQFPALSRTYKGQPLVFLDGPAGSQVPQSVIDAISDYYRTSNANSHGFFITTRETDALLDSVRQKAADFLGAEGPDTISFGQNMTTLNFALSRAIGRILQPGDEVLITQLDHEANRQPWLSLREKGIIVREIKIQPDGRLNYDDFRQKLNERTRLVAMGYASNIFGTVNDVLLARKLTHEVGAWLLLDAVHAAPHLPISATQIGCDFLLCSAYKFYGPHIGILYAKPGLLDQLPTDRLRTAPQTAPGSIETGTLNHAAIAGVGAAIDFIANLGAGKDYREKLRTGMAFIQKKERSLAKQLADGLSQIKGVTVYGPDFDGPRAPTIAFAMPHKSADQICAELAETGICAWSGHFYAIRATEVLGLLEKGGVVRMGCMVYNTPDEVARTLEALRKI
ncbi:MAG: cysteine desulfurase-like protein [Bacteroidetes bacterium]|nr:MAG: cysteine desulfurase-like protein [Bacteroidota bacterium]